MTAFHYAFDGVWLGGAVVVLAETEAEARELLLREHGALDGLTLEDARHCGEPGVVYFWDGDY